MKITCLILVMEKADQRNKDGSKRKQRKRRATAALIGARQLPLPFLERPGDEHGAAQEAETSKG
jgi:hypothetical protein